MGCGVTRLPVFSLANDPDNPRFDLGDLGGLVESIRDKGVLQPLLVRPGTINTPQGTCFDCGQTVGRVRDSRLLVEHLDAGRPCPGGSLPASDDYWIVAGHRRSAAVREVIASETDPVRVKKFWDVPVIVRHDLSARSERLMVMFEENTHRHGLSPVEEAHVFEQLVLEGVTVSQIARRVSRRRTTVERRLLLNGLPAGVKRDLHSGQLSLFDAERLLNLPPEKQALVEAHPVSEAPARITAAETGLDVDTQRAEVAARLRAKFVDEILGGQRRPKSSDLLSDLIPVMFCVVPGVTRRAWVKRLGDRPMSVDPVKALAALLDVVDDVTVVYPVLEKLGYKVSPVERLLLDG